MQVIIKKNIYKTVRLYLFSLFSNPDKNVQFLFRLVHNFVNHSSLLSRFSFLLQFNGLE